MPLWARGIAARQAHLFTEQKACAMKTVSLVVSDETLRDGEQQAGLIFDMGFKRTLADLILDTGVHQVALLPAVHESEARLAQSLLENGHRHRLAASTLLAPRFVDGSVGFGFREVILFHAVSDRLLFLRDPTIQAMDGYRHKTIDDGIPDKLLADAREAMLEKVVACLKYAADRNLGICFAAEDASRTDFDFLVRCIKAFGPYLRHFLLCDTVGALTPEHTHAWVTDLLRATDGAPLAVHFHNDLGLALENTLQALLAGAMGVSGTFSGIGERAGNAPLEQVLHGLRVRLGWEVEGIDYGALERVVHFLQEHGVRPNPPYSTGARRHETGIHVDSLRQDARSYSILPFEEPDVWFGKYSGSSNFEYLFERHLDQPLTHGQAESLRDQIKELSVRENRCFSTADVLVLLAEGELTV